jgi:hypothetical protein
MCRYTLMASMSMAIMSCSHDETINIEDSCERYLLLRRSHSSSILTTVASVKHRPTSESSRRVRGDLRWICTEIHGVDNPRILIEAKRDSYYEVIYQVKDAKALELIAGWLDLVVVREERNCKAITIRTMLDGHCLKPSPKEAFTLDDVTTDEQQNWRLEGATMDDLARFLEWRLRTPVVNRTLLQGHWSVSLSPEVGKTVPTNEYRIHGLGLILSMEDCRIPMLVVKERER